MNRWKRIIPKATNKTIDDLKMLIHRQIDDEGLWFVAETGPEAYLQDALRKLHRLCEEVIGKK